MSRKGDRLPDVPDDELDKAAKEAVQAIADRIDVQPSEEKQDTAAKSDGIAAYFPDSFAFEVEVFDHDSIESTTVTITDVAYVEFGTRYVQFIGRGGGLKVAYPNGDLGVIRKVEPNA